MNRIEGGPKGNWKVACQHIGDPSSVAKIFFNIFLCIFEFLIRKLLHISKAKALSEMVDMRAYFGDVSER